MSTARTSGSFKQWFLEIEQSEPEGFYENESAVRVQHHQHPWWKVMCLTGVDYFSTLGYQPGIAALAAGPLAPVATLVLVLVTLFGALPMYRRVAQESPHGDGSISMLERLLSYWPGKLLVLTLIGFVATGFIITITLSAADATAHLVENPFLKARLDGYQVPLTLALIGLLGGVFLKGFKEAIGIAVAIVVLYIGLNLVVIGKGTLDVLAQPAVLTNWQTGLAQAYQSPLAMTGAALLVFPRLALGLSGFETGVVVMPLVQGGPGDARKRLAGRIRNTKKLLTTAALLMSALLLGSAMVTTLLIPPDAFRPGGEASGRALAYLAHERLGDAFGSLYDAATILILWFAGASAMAGLLNIVPRYLPRYGMAPDWSRASRPLVVIFVALSALVTILFRANVETQAGAYATGVLALMTSAAVAVFLTEVRRKHARSAAVFAVISALFIYTSVVTVADRPEGLFIALLFIAAILTVSVASRVSRSTELRVQHVTLDGPAQQLLRETVLRGLPVRFIANRLHAGDSTEYHLKELEVRLDTHLPQGEPALFLEVAITDASNFTDTVQVQGVRIGRHAVLRAGGSSVPNTIAAVLLHVRDVTGSPPHVYFEWSETGPAANALRFLLAGEGDIPPLTHEVLRVAEPNQQRRPIVHVGG
ncbi:APC family permease [Deinococcus deserti]|uniref:Amino acid transporter n=1 Tax=Deinococcus deserti (strain DSM 17065 / CIP 109153 / LMG 22923 / VCD115) TaxID=546414 RepID=C1D482_DEIDV|nr:APC family permease [Deinococcus deserti]ACO47963.2 Conserved hypothetical protein; putative membrane protein [Deinococcus deserti VCD115]